MSGRWTILVVVLAVGCNGGKPPEPAPDPAKVTVPTEPQPEPQPEPVPDPLPAPEPAPIGDDPKPDAEAALVRGMYEACFERVEMPQTKGECKTSDDCGSGGCSGEMCVARSLGAITSTCEVKPCFAVLDTCGCVDGQCQWSLKASAPSPRPITPIE